MLLLKLVLFVALLISIFELRNNTVFCRVLLPIFAVCKISEAAATEPAMSKADMLCVIHF